MLELYIVDKSLSEEKSGGDFFVEQKGEKKQKL